MREAFVDWLLVLVTGRVLLAFLPPSSIGSRRSHTLVATLVASTLAGTAARWPQALAWCGLDLPLPSDARGSLLWLAPWLLAAIAWRALGPGALVPRQEAADFDPRSWRALEAGLQIAALAGLLLSFDATLQAGLLGLPAHWPFAAGIAFGLHWRKRADRRALVLAAIAFGLCAGTRRVEGWLGVLGWAGLVLATPAPARRRALLVALFALLCVGLPLAWAEVDKTGRYAWWGIEL
jgi:hypothetical protein